ncbi:hypothetical protein MKEN_00034500 [Mycena kentingensis (nom. inval.)]|nr:hypothetical protein MKEN_00034500 [Mycena kentingensis (nom. inval.)]
MTSDADRLRIAIALTALKFKPSDVSCASYVLQLQAAFPPSKPAAPTADGSWKAHALSLEKELAGLRKKLDAAKIKSIAAPSPLPPPETSAEPVQKRKPKKKGSNKQTEPEVLTSKSQFTSHPSLFASLESFDQLVSVLDVEATTAAQRSLLMRTSILVVSGIADVFQPILQSKDPCVEAQRTTLQGLASVMSQVLSSALPILLRKTTSVTSLVNKLLDALISSVLTPTLEALVPLNNRYLHSLFPLDGNAPDVFPVDIRPDALHLFQSAYNPLVSVSSSFQHNLRNTLALVAIAQLDALFPPADAEPNLNGHKPKPKTHVMRVDALAQKDAVAYLCSVLDLLFAAIPSASASAPTFEQRIVDSLTKILRRCRRSGGELDWDVIDEVGYEMILGVVEGYWRYTGVVQPSVSDES